MKLKSSVTLTLVSAVAISIFAIKQALTSPSLEWHGHRLADCIGRNDADCVLGYMPSNEVSQLGIKRETINWLISQHKLAVAAPVSIRVEDDARGVVFTALYARPGENGKSLNFKMTSTSEGAKAPALITGLVLAEIETPYRDGIERVRNWIRHVEIMQFSYEYHGMPKVIPGYDMDAVTWDEFIALQEARITRLETPTRNLPPKPGG